MGDTFDDLFIEKEELNKDILKKILTGKVKLINDGNIIFQKVFQPKHSIILYLLSNKIFLMKKIKEKEADGPREIHLKTGVPEGTVKRYVRELEKEGLLIRTEGGYYVPNHALIKIEKIMEENDRRD